MQMEIRWYYLLHIQSCSSQANNLPRLTRVNASYQSLPTTSMLIKIIFILETSSCKITMSFMMQHLLMIMERISSRSELHPRTLSHQQDNKIHQLSLCMRLMIKILSKKTKLIKSKKEATHKRLEIIRLV